MALKIVRNDITQMRTEAIVNTANENALVGSGCDQAIYEAAGYDKLLSYRRDNIGHAEEGSAFLTPGFNLAAKYIIHAVSPIFNGGREEEEEKLRSCYRNSLNIAKENDIQSIAFPLIATGGFGYPKEEGMRIAVDEINAFLLHNNMDIYLVVFDDKATKLGSKIYPDLELYINQNYVDETIKKEYSSRNYRWEEAGPKAASPQAASPMVASPKAPSPKSAGPREAKGANPIGDFLSRSIFKSSKIESKEIEMAQMRPMASGCASDSKYIDFEEEHRDKLDERMKHLSDTFSQYLLYLADERNMPYPDVYNRAIVSKKNFSKIKNDPNYHPTKLTALRLCIGLKLNLDETKDLLLRAGYALSPCDKTDIIFSYFIENKIYDMIELDLQLEEHGLPCIIS